MALPINVTELINGRLTESYQIEFIRYVNLLSILHSICAFANDIDNCGGGYIIIEIEKSSSNHIIKELFQKCKLIEPSYTPLLEHTKYKGEDVIIIWAPGGDSRPYSCPVVFNNKKAYYIRKHSNTVRANKSQEKEIFQLANNIPFDDQANMKARVEDMRVSLISDYLYTTGSDLYDLSSNLSVRELAAKMHLVRDVSGQEKPINAGLMFFNERPDHYFPYARIELIDKPDPRGFRMTEKVFTGPLDKQLKDTLSFIQNYVITKKIIKSNKKAEADHVFNYPYMAVKEVLSNAVYHKSYQISEPIYITVTPDAIEILSFPGPDSSISDEDIANNKMVAIRYRNRRIGDFLKALKLVKGQNTGIPTMLSAMSKNGSPAPIFETDDKRSYLKVILPIHEEFSE